MQRYFSTILLICISFLLHTSLQAYSQMILPEWYVGESDFRHATVDDKGRLTDSYTRLGSDTVNIIDTKAQGEYSLNIFLEITNWHAKSDITYPQYYYDKNGQKRKGKGTKRPIYGWVVGMKDMLHYNAIWIRPTLTDDELYESAEIEYCVVSINNNDTIYHTDWKTCHSNNLVNKDSRSTFWLQYNNNTLWFGGGYNHDIPWDIIYNVPSFGSYTGLYLASGAKVSIDDAWIVVNDKQTQPRTLWTKELLSEYFKDYSHSYLEGFWDVTYDFRHKNQVKMGGNYMFGIIYNGSEYDVIYIDGAEKYPNKWQEGDIKAKIIHQTTSLYKVIWYDAEGEKMDNEIYAYIDNGLLNITFKNENVDLLLTRSSINETPTFTKKTCWGSGFIITPDGYIATNHHVIDNAKEIKVFCPSSENIQKYKAEIVAQDSINDLAILHICDSNFVSFKDIPYGISDRKCRTGESVFYMGYPQPKVLLTHVKTSTGEISAEYGLRQSTYMTSIDIDHGSSGSPVFDSEGSIIGIAYGMIQKELSRITASYAVKSIYLFSLANEIEGLKIERESKIKELSYPDKLEAIAPYIFLIECEF